MRNRFFYSAIAVIAVLAAVLIAQAQTVPRSPEGKPDFSGFWSNPRGKSSTGPATVFTRCFPSGFPSGFFGPYPVQIVQSKDYLVMVTEFQRITRLIPLDGRPHRKGLEPTYYGDSVAHWEDDTLVIDSTNFRRWSLDDYYYMDPLHYRMHTEAFHTIERLRRTDTNTIAYQITIDDPKIFTAPWSEDFEMKLHPEWDEAGLYEFVCEENNRCAGGQCRK